MSSVIHLISIGASHYCEKARWALDRAGVLYSESKHVMVLHILFTRGLGPTTSCPKLVMGRGSERVVLQQSSDILKFADMDIRNEEDRLYPGDPEQNEIVQSWESKFDKQLGAPVRRWAYCGLLFSSYSFRMATEGVPRLERYFAWFLMPVLRRLVYRVLKLNRPGTKEHSLQAVEAIFKEVDEVLADGRPYICGEIFTAADLTFASLGAFMVAPPEYVPWGPSLENLPSDMSQTIQRFRKTPAGKHILKIYETKRGKPRERKVHQ